MLIGSASILPTIVGNPTIFKSPSIRLEFPPKIRLKSQNPTVANFKKKFPLKSVCKVEIRQWEHLQKMKYPTKIPPFWDKSH